MRNAIMLFEFLRTIFNVFVNEFGLYNNVINKLNVAERCRSASVSQLGRWHYGVGFVDKYCIQNI